MPSLPDKPDLDQLKKQAKDLRKAFNAGDADARRTVDAHYRDAPPGELKLAQAQLVIARAHGFDSWPKLKAFVDGVTIARFMDTVRAGDIPGVRAMLKQRPELVHMDTAPDDEHRGIHHAVLRRDAPMVDLLMEAGSDARKGVYPHRDATTALMFAEDRGFDDIVDIIKKAEQDRREAMSCPNLTVSDEQEKVTKAIAAGKRDEAMAMLEANPALIKACDATGRTPLHVAASAADAAMVEWLTTRRADASKQDSGGWTPLERAVIDIGWRQREKTAAFPHIAKALLARGCPYSPFAAAALGDVERLAQCTDQDLARIAGVYNGGVLSAAVRFSQPEALAHLLSRGLDTDERTQITDLETPTYSWGHPLWLAAAYGEYDMAEQLIAAGADVNSEVYASGNPMSQAYGVRDERMKKLLRQYGAHTDASTIGYHADTEAARAAFAGEMEVRYDRDNETLAEALIGSAVQGADEAIVQMCLERINWPADDDRWFGGLLRAMGCWALGPHRTYTDHVDRAAYPRMMRLFIKRGADVNASGRRNVSLLHQVSTCGIIWGRDVLTLDEHVGRATILIDAGARFDVRDDLLRSTPLGWACRWGRLELVQLFIDRGAAVNEPDAEPWATPLAWATTKNHDAIAALLRNAGANH